MKRLPLILTIAFLSSLAFLLWKRSTAENGKYQAPESPSTTTTDPKFWESITVREADPDSPPAPPLHEYYSDGIKTRDGTGKFYQGREIAQVMGHPALTWLERDNREDEESPSIAMQILDLAETEVLADIGAGSGYYSLRIAMLRPRGRVIAVDIQPEMLDFLEQRMEKIDVQNISPHLGNIDDIGLPADSIDSALMVDAYHEFSHPYEMMQSIKKALRPGGRVYLLEYRAEDPSVPIKPLHKMTQAQVKKEMSLIGLEWEKTLDDLPWQHLMVFRKP
jgi:SAM-dependent methyltransferase